VLTNDRQTMPGFARQRLAAGLPMPGVLVTRPAASVRDIIDALLIIDGCGEPEDFADRIEFIPYDPSR
jgi:hypothetical protein